MDRAEAIGRLRSGRVGRLATVRPDGTPHVVPVVFAVVEDGDRLRAFWAVDHKPKRSTTVQRIRNIQTNPNVELVVDSYDEDWRELWWVRASGTARVIEDADERAFAVAALVGKYPPYVDTAPAGDVVEIEIDRVTWWSA
jgi:PPOX class probable F420-dependent enzyme